jgi:hypothetical protein
MEHTCGAAGCISTETSEIGYAETDGSRHTGWFCEEDGLLIQRRGTAAMVLRYMDQQRRALPSLEALQADPSLWTSGAGDQHLRALDDFLQAHHVVVADLERMPDPAAKALAAQAQPLADRAEALLTSALQARQE